MSYDGLPAALRRAVIERDGGRCRWCGATNRGADLHHIEYRRGVAYDVLENLVSLCRSCHSFVHGNPRASGARIDKATAQDVLFWVIDHPGTVGTSRWARLKREERSGATFIPNKRLNKHPSRWRNHMSESQPESTPEQNIEADQVVVNNAPDGGGVDNNEAPEPSPAAEPSEGAPEGDSDSE